MKSVKYKFLAFITLMFLGLSLNSCGGTTDNKVVDGGISGTGITMGRITKFGSIYVNGVRFDIDKATFKRDGLISKGQEDFSIGEYIVIKGSIDVSKTSGIASEVIFEDILEGAVTLVSNDSISLEILGQTIKTDNITVFHGVNSINDLVAGNIVEVSGYKDAAGIIQATSIKLKQNEFVNGVSENELKGTISNLSLQNKTFMLGSILVDYNLARFEDFNGIALVNGQYVEVKSNSPIVGGLLLAKKVELKAKNSSVISNTKLEVEGVVTRFVSSKDFDVNGILVTSNAQTKYEKGSESDLALNSVVEIEGIVNSASVLVADEIKFETDGENTGGSDSEDDGSDEDNNDSENDDSDSEDDDSDAEDDDSDSEDDDSNEGNDDSDSE